MTGELHVESLVSAERETAVGILARAFRDNPLDRAVIGDDPGRRLDSIRYGMRASLRSAMDRCTVLLARHQGSPAGVLLAVPPGGFPLPPPSLLAHLRSVLGQGIRVTTRWGDVYRALEEVHPVEPHWYLSLLGVDPPRQGHGVGIGTLKCWLECVDRDGLPSYLETDRQENVAFYERVGFAVHLELKVLETPVWCMRRVASASLPRTGVSHVLHTP